MSGSVEEFYGRYAGLYDRVARFGPVERWRARAADALELSPGDTVLEVGCGTGANAAHLRRRVGPGGRVVGVDLTRPLLRVARERAARAGWRNVHFVRADATRPPVERADAVLASFVVGLLDDPAGAVGGWCDLADGGRVALLDGASSSHPVGRACNPLFGAFVGAGSPAPTLAASLRQAAAGLLDGPRRDLDRKVRASREALAARTRDRRYETFALGFVGLLAGRVD